MSFDTKNALREGVADALGFVLGALAGWGLGLQLGIDFIGNTDWGLTQLAGLVLILAGSGLGRWLMRRLLLKSGKP